eukprot:SAG22_NODE_84_length_21617_cov_48.600102_2_plen_181_part_00
MAKWKSWTIWIHLLSGNSLPVENGTTAQIEFSIADKIYTGRPKAVRNKWVRWDELYEDIVIPGLEESGDRDFGLLPGRRVAAAGPFCEPDGRRDADQLLPVQARAKPAGAVCSRMPAARGQGTAHCPALDCTGLHWTALDSLLPIPPAGTHTRLMSLARALLPGSLSLSLSLSRSLSALF